jgi:hypothetical protein
MQCVEVPAFLLPVTRRPSPSDECPHPKYQASSSSTISSLPVFSSSFPTQKFLRSPQATLPSFCILSPCTPFSLFRPHHPKVPPESHAPPNHLHTNPPTNQAVTMQGSFDNVAPGLYENSAHRGVFCMALSPPNRDEESKAPVSDRHHRIPPSIGSREALSCTS